MAEKREDILEEVLEELERESAEHHAGQNAEDAGTAKAESNAADDEADAEQEGEDAQEADEAEAGIQVLLLSKQLEQLNTEAKSIESMLQAANPLCWHIRIQELTPELLREFVQSITVYPDGIINIMWNYKEAFDIPDMTCE